MLWLPAARVLTCSVATLFASVEVPNVPATLSVKTTLPVGVPALPETRAVSVIAVPGVGEALLVVNVVVVAVPVVLVADELRLVPL